jgi:hypothetical protein
LLRGTNLQKNFLSPGAWTLERFQAEEPPETFALYLPANLVTGIADGLYSFQRCTARPGNGRTNANAVVVLRDLGTTPGISIGRWLYQRTTDPDRPHRVRLRRLTNPASMDLTEAEFNQLQILAVAISSHQNQIMGRPVLHETQPDRFVGTLVATITSNLGLQGQSQTL